MAEADKLDATFYAFKQRDRRLVMTRAAIGYVALYAIAVAIYIALAWNSFAPLVAWYAAALQAVTQGGEPPTPPAELFALLPYAGFVALVAFGLFAAFEAACLRWLVRGESGGGLLGLKADADTWRVLATYFVWLGLFVAFSILIAIFYVVVNVVANLGGPARIVAMLLGALAPLGFIALLIWGAVTFAPAAATSIARRRFAFFAAPGIVRGHFWQLLGSFLILWLGYCVISLIVGQILQIPAQSALAPVIRDMARGDMGSIGPKMVEAMSSPAYLLSMGANMVFGVIAGIVFYVAMFGVNARAVLAAQASAGTTD